jgi:hypothetical protein
LEVFGLYGEALVTDGGSRQVFGLADIASSNRVDRIKKVKHDQQRI